MERQNAGNRRGRLRGELECQPAGERRLRRLGHRYRSHRRRLRARGERGWHLQPAVHPGLHPERDQAAGALLEVDRAHVLRGEARLQLLERLLDRRPPGLSARAGARQGARRRPSERPGDLLDAIPDGADVGADRHEGPGWRPDFRGQAQPGDRLGGRRLRRRRRRGGRRDRRSADMQVQRDGEHLRHADRAGGELPDATRKPKRSTRSGTDRGTRRATRSGSGSIAAPTFRA